MKRSIKLFNKPYSIALLVMMLSVVSLSSFAQSEEKRESQSVSITNTEDGKVKLKVTKKVGDDETTFEKTYDSYDDIEGDPDLEKYGIDLGNFGFSSSGSSPRIFFHNGPSSGFWNNDEWEDEMEELRERMKFFMDEDFGGSFMFNIDPDDFMPDIDSLMQNFRFDGGQGSFFFNGEKVDDLDSLQDFLKDRFKNFSFDFDFGDSDDDDARVFRFNGDEEEEGVKTISRVSVYVKSASEEDKKKVGTSTKEPLELRDVSFYPNPSDGRFDISLETGSEAPINVSIIDNNGEEVFNKVGSPTEGKFEFKVDISDEPKGIYIMKVLQNNKALTKRLIVK